VNMHVSISLTYTGSFSFQDLNETVDKRMGENFENI